MSKTGFTQSNHFNILFIGDDFCIMKSTTGRLKIVAYDGTTGRELEIGPKIYMNNNTGNIGEIFIYAGTTLTHNAISAFNKDIKLAENKKLYLSDNLSCYIWSNAADSFRVNAGGTSIGLFTSSGIFYYRNLAVNDPGYLLMQRLAGGLPGGSPDYAKMCVADVGGKAHMFSVDEDGNAFDMTPTVTFTGSWVNQEGKTVTVVKGIITTVV